MAVKIMLKCCQL